VLVVNRFREGAGDPGDDLRTALEGAHAALAERPGYVDGTLGRNLDDPALWVLVTRWQDVGSYRRALSSYEVKLRAVPTLSRALDEPSAFEIAEPGETLNEAGARSL